MSYRISNCCAFSPDQLCAAMNAAFSDYVIPLSLSVEGFRTFQRQRGFSAEHSFAALQGEDIVAFWFSGSPRPEFGSRAYTLSVGTLPDHRRKGLSRKLLKAVVDQQRVSTPSTGLQLEVITSNQAAIGSYEAMGFSRHRTLRVLKLNKEPQESSYHSSIVPLELEEIPEQTGGFFDAEPTPQNSRSALQALDPDLHLLGVKGGGSVLAWGAVYPDGAVAQLAVHQTLRRKGLGSAILSEMWNVAAQRSLTFVNVDDSADGLNAFLEKAGAEELLQQYEMRFGFT